jgi:hypothetical protein
MVRVGWSVSVRSDEEKESMDGLQVASIVPEK